MAFRAATIPAVLSMLALAVLHFGLAAGAHAEADGAADVDAYVDGWGPAIGSVAPVIDAPDHSGAPRTLENLRGEHGLLLLFSRSADW